MTAQIAQRIGNALSVSSATKLRELDQALREFVRSVGPAAATPISGVFDASQVTSGTFAAARIPALSLLDASGLGNFANDAAAAAGGVAVGRLYRNGSIVQVRVV